MFTTLPTHVTCEPVGKEGKAFAKRRESPLMCVVPRDDVHRYALTLACRICGEKLADAPKLALVPLNDLNAKARPVKTFGKG